MCRGAPHQSTMGRQSCHSSIMMKTHLLFLLVICASSTASQQYGDIEKSITSVPFGTGHIPVWQHEIDQDRFYALPLVYLLKDSTRVGGNVFTQKTELLFDVLMWSLEAKEAVQRHLQISLNRTIADHSIDN